MSIKMELFPDDFQQKTFQDLIGERLISQKNEQMKFKNEFRKELYERIKFLIDKIKNKKNESDEQFEFEIDFTFPLKLNDESKESLLKEIMGRFPKIYYQKQNIFSTKFMSAPKINAHKYTIVVI
jgi:hypothetical protein